jgi:predicted ATPase
VDAHRFEATVARARAAGAAGEPSAALDAYDEALSMWRGPALADVADAEWARAEIARLDELRLGAQEERLELLLEAGRHAEATADLESLVVEHPLRERLHRLLMLALYRGGRQADALAVHQALRHRLADELGIDPSPDLQALAEAILRQQVPGSATPQAAVPPAGERPPRAPAGEPPPRAVAPPTGGDVLPRRLSSVVGRDHDVRAVSERLHEARVVTLTGPGGVGKTTLALEVARRAGPPLADAVHLIRLAAVDVDADVATVFATQLGVVGGPGTDSADAVVARLRGRRVLLVVDNCEHVVDDVAALVEHLLEATGDVRVLATSREALAVPGEMQVAVGPLTVPAETVDPDGIAATPSVQLFVERARAVRPGFVLDAESAPVVAAICRRLDGIPLALELAAARMKALSPAAIAARLQDRFALLTAGPRTSEARHRTLRATIDWSHELLSEPERRLLRRLAVFRGGWTLAAAEQVCGFGGLVPADVPDVLFRLVDRSLVVPEPATGRFRLLVTIREYALARLRDAGELDAALDRHLAYCTELAERYGPEVRFGGAARDRLHEEQDNLRAAVDLCVDRAADDPGAGLRLTTPLVWFWMYGLRFEGVRALTALLEAGGGSEIARARALQGIGVLHVYYPTPASRAATRAALAVFERAGDLHDAAVSRLIVAWEGQYGGDPDECRAFLDSSRQQLADSDRCWWKGMAYYVEALLDLRLSRFQASADGWLHCHELMRTLGDHPMASAVRAHLGVALRQLGRADEAVEVLRDAVAEARAVGSLHGLAFALVHQAHTELDLGRLDAVPPLIVEADEVAARARNPRCPAWATWARARLAWIRGDAAAAADGYRSALALLEDREFPWARAQLWTALADAAEAAGRTAEADRARATAATLDPAT